MSIDIKNKNHDIKNTNTDIKNVLEWLEHTAEAFPEKTAFDDGTAQICFRDVKDGAQKIGAGLLQVLEQRAEIQQESAGCQPSEERNLPVAILSGRNIYTPIAFLGAVYAGCFYAPLDGTAPAERLKTILKNLQPAVFIVSEEYEELAGQLLQDLTDGTADAIVSAKKVFPLVSLEELLKTEVTEADRLRFQKIREAMQPDDPLYVIHTSGSSGTPKGVLTGHASLINYINAYTKVMGITSEDILGNQSPLDYIAAIRDIYIPLKMGAGTYIIPKKDFTTPALLFPDMTEKKVTSIGWSVNALTIPANMGVFEKGRPAYLNKICFSGSVMPCKVLRIWQDNLPDAKFVNQYGPTEATASCTYYEVEGKVAEEDVLPIGKPYDNYDVFLLNEDLTPTKKGEIGEICVGGPVLALGYINAPLLTANSFIKDPRGGEGIIYKTGDLGSMAEDGNLLFHGRKDRQIKHLGHRVELGEIEEAAGRAEGVSDCAALYKQDKEQIYLFYTGAATAKELAVALRKTLPGFMVPRKFVLLEQMPVLANGKVDMQTLKGLMEN